MTKIKKRFVAGATCPHCNAVDTVLLFSENNIATIECIACGYSKQQVEEIKPVHNSAQIIGIFKQK